MEDAWLTGRSAHVVYEHSTAVQNVPELERSAMA